MLFLPVLNLDEEMLSGFGYESIPKGFEGEDTPARGVRGLTLAKPEVFFFACLNRDWRWWLAESHPARIPLIIVMRCDEGIIGFDVLLRGVVGGVTPFKCDRLVSSLALAHPLLLSNSCVAAK